LANLWLTCQFLLWHRISNDSKGMGSVHRPFGTFVQITKSLRQLATNTCTPQESCRINGVAAGDRLTLGWLVHGQNYVSNTIRNATGKVHIDGGSSTNTEIRDNTLLGTNDYPFLPLHRLRMVDDDPAPQCLRATSSTFRAGNLDGVWAGTQRINLAKDASVTGNTCEHGDISFTVFTWGGEPRDAGWATTHYWADNALGNGGQGWTYRANRLPSDPNCCAATDEIEPVDTTDPAITWVRPSRTRDRTPRVGATVRGYRARRTRRTHPQRPGVALDGSERTAFSYDAGEDLLVHDSKRLSWDRRPVEISATDDAVITTTVTKTFKIVRRT
jgi:hypothetical protein